MSKPVVVSGGFDDLRTRQIRFLQEAARIGPVTVLMWNDEALRQSTGAAPKFLQVERQYILQAIRFVSQVRLVNGPADADALPDIAGLKPDCWVVEAAAHSPAKESFCARRDIRYHVLHDEDVAGFSEIPAAPSPDKRKKVVVTGCYDWFHSGHVRFFEEVSGYGDRVRGGGQ